MSDAMWDIEYDKAYDLKQEIIELCNKKDIEMPKLKESARSWELKSMLNELKR